MTKDEERQALHSIAIGMAAKAEKALDQSLEKLRGSVARAREEHRVLNQEVARHSRAWVGWRKKAEELEG